MTILRRFYLHLYHGLGTILISAVIAGCNPTGSTGGGGTTSQPSDGTGETPQPIACSERGYFNTDFHFGFDPPQGFTTGPIIAFGTDYSAFPVLHQAFTVPLAFSRRVDIEVFSTTQSLGQWVATVRAQRLFGGYISQTSQDFTTDGGIPATLLVWTSTQGLIYEAFAARGSFIIALYAKFSLIDSAFVDAPVRASLRTLCVDPVE